MSADLLRRAAEKLREHANAATPGPWSWECLEDGYGDYMLYNVLGPEGNGVTPIPLQTRTEDAGFYSQAEADISFAALMHPPVALALADWLTWTVDNYRIETDSPEGPCCAEPSVCGGHDEEAYHYVCGDPVPCACIQPALAAARAILREES